MALVEEGRKERKMQRWITGKHGAQKTWDTNKTMG